jgi:hypothetical protein
VRRSGESRPRPAHRPRRCECAPRRPRRPRRSERDRSSPAARAVASARVTPAQAPRTSAPARRKTIPRAPPRPPPQVRRRPPGPGPQPGAHLEIARRSGPPFAPRRPHPHPSHRPFAQAGSDRPEPQPERRRRQWPPRKEGPRWHRRPARLVFDPRPTIVAGGRSLLTVANHGLDRCSGAWRAGRPLPLRVWLPDPAGSGYDCSKPWAVGAIE